MAKYAIVRLGKDSVRISSPSTRCMPHQRLRLHSRSLADRFPKSWM